MEGHGVGAVAGDGEAADDGEMLVGRRVDALYKGGTAARSVCVFHMCVSHVCIAGMNRAWTDVSHYSRSHVSTYAVGGDGRSRPGVDSGARLGCSLAGGEILPPHYPHLTLSP